MPRYFDTRMEGVTYKKIKSMRVTKYITTLLLSLLMLSCSDKKKQDATSSDHNKQDNHIYYLSIGNAHYKKDSATETFGNVQGANISADLVANNFAAYGSGLLLKSTKVKPLTKEIINTYVDSIVNIAIKDSLSTTFIYFI